jgi:protein-tyrosine phosphatase
VRILVVCSANQVRSPMAAALLRRRLAVHDPGAEVVSAGFGASGFGATPQTIRVMAEVGIDLEDHRSRRVTRADLEAADLAVGMTRRHVMDLALLNPAAWPRIFALRALVTRGLEIGPRWGSERAAAWVERAHAGRERSSVAGLDVHSDVVDPLGRRTWAYAHTRDQLATLLAPPAPPAALRDAPDPPT